MTSRDALAGYCAEIGHDRLLVQAAGGNASWKEGGTLWVKASGTWLAEAQKKDIFLPVDLEHLTDGMARGDYDLAPKVIRDSSLGLTVRLYMWERPET